MNQYDGNIVNLLGNNTSFESKVKITGKTPAAGNTKYVKIAIPLKYLNNFWKTLEMLLVNCEINLIRTCSSTLLLVQLVWEHLQ